MSEWVNRYWRIFGTGLSFLLFGVGGIVFRAFIFPTLFLIARTPDRHMDWSRRAIRFSFRAFIEVMRFFGVLNYRVDGLNQLDRQGLLIVSNHPTLLDIVFLLAFVKDANCIVKTGLWSNPFIKGPVSAAGYIKNSDNEGFIGNCVASLEAGNNLIIFPEGTRTSDDETIALKRGAANIAIRGKKNITPVLIHCDPPSLKKNEKWWEISRKMMHFTIVIGEDIEVDSFIDDNKNSILAVRRLTRHLQDYYNHEYRRYKLIAQ